MFRLASITLLLFPLLLCAQVRHTVSGTIRDAASGETLIGASVLLFEQPRSAVLSNSFGFYSISSTPGRYKLVISFTGYRSDTVNIDLDRDVLLDIQLSSGGG